MIFFSWSKKVNDMERVKIARWTRSYLGKVCLFFLATTEESTKPKVWCAPTTAATISISLLERDYETASCCEDTAFSQLFTKTFGKFTITTATTTSTSLLEWDYDTTSCCENATPSQSFSETFGTKHWLIFNFFYYVSLA